MKNNISSRGWLGVFLLFTFALLLGFYTWLRYGGSWSYGDSAAFTWVARGIMDSGELVPSQGAYPHGYGYQALVVSLATLTGLHLHILQLAGGALLIGWVILPAWLVYREFTRSDLVASLAVVILLVQPDFLFPLLRGTHEKFTRGLMFLLVYLLLRSLRTRNVRKAGALVAAFYLAAYGLITMNNLLATSFVMAIGLALVVLWALRRFFLADLPNPKRLFQRLGLIIFSLLVLTFLFTFYVYPPAQQQLRVLQSIADRLAILFLQVEEVEFNPYATVNQGWINLPIYFLVSLANWLLLLFSFLIWLWQAYRWWLRGENPHQTALLLWAFYAAFAVQGILSVLVDFSGAIAGNLQHRIFPSFSMFAAPVLAGWVISMFHAISEKRRNILRWGLGWGLGLLMFLAVIKATTEPLFSNYWRFYTPGEFQAVNWAERALEGRSIGVGFNDRLSAGYQIKQDGRSLGLVFDYFDMDFQANDLLISSVNQLHSERLVLPLPVASDSYLTYDNGDAQMYHTRPKTPFQR